MISRSNYITETSNDDFIMNDIKITAESNLRSLPLIRYAPRGELGGQSSSTFLLHITCKVGGPDNIKNAYVIN